MAVIPISDKVAVMLRERGVCLSTDPDPVIPDDWLALLEQMNGSCEPARPGRTARWEAQPG